MEQISEKEYAGVEVRDRCLDFLVLSSGFCNILRSD